MTINETSLNQNKQPATIEYLTESR